MFTRLRLFDGLDCPDVGCCRPGCIFSHQRVTRPSNDLVNSSDLITIDQTTVLPAKDPQQKQQQPRIITINQSIRISQVQQGDDQLIEKNSSLNQSSEHVKPRIGRGNRFQTELPTRKSVRTSSEQVRYQPTPESLKPPRIQITRSTKSHTSTSNRQKLLQSLYDSYLSFYSKQLELSDRLSRSLAHRDSLREEEDCMRLSTGTTYRNMIINRLVTLKKRKVDRIDSLGSFSSSSSSSSLEKDELLIKYFTGTIEQFDKNQVELKRLEQKRLIEKIWVSDPNRRSSNGEDQEEEEKNFKRKRKILEKYLLTREKMKSLDYITELEPEKNVDDEYLKNLERKDKGLSRVDENLMHRCERCMKDFKLSKNAEEDCEFHWGRPRFEKVDGVKQKVYDCCNEISTTKRCTRGRHVFLEKLVSQLNARTRFSRLKAAEAQSSSTGSERIEPIELAAIDCEMVYTSAGLTLARSTIVIPSKSTSTQRQGPKINSSKILLDEYVRIPESVDVFDLNTRFSGIRSVQSLREAKYSLEELRDQVLPSLGIFSQTILCGHGLENDLKAMRILHDQCIDTVDLFPHPKGLPMRNSLKNLALENLKRSIQVKEGSKDLKSFKEEEDDDDDEEEEEEEGLKGHDSLEDSLTVLDLKCQKGIH
ncbi:hypothetical protein BY996DRAFT_4121375 [Phakopsora pachyrhizi]|nr:hypothetical protein BY996DRAFT_4121375 [Phakopsora pachyrhizi]